MRPWLGALSGGLCFAAFGLVSASAVSVTDTTGWNAWKTTAGVVMTDPAADQQTGQGQDDFVGTLTSGQEGFQQKAGLLDTDSANKYIVFRVRMGKYDSVHGFGGNLSLGLDLTGTGAINLIMDMQDKSGQTLSFASPGTGANTSPSTTSWGNFAGSIALNSTAGSPITYNYQAATGGTVGSYTATGNAWVTFAISYANLQAAIRAYAGASFSSFTMSDSTPLSFIAFTSTQGNAINQDLFGTSGNMNSASTFSSLGAGTMQILPGGGPVPELPAFYQLAGLFGVGLAGWFWKNRRRQVELQPAQA